ncbi:oxidoreductase [Aureococcus anophagefferens]|nr:oxidoreductase [Aureococcus anophagefferens]
MNSSAASMDASAAALSAAAAAAPPAAPAQWACRACTFVHDGPENMNFLACALCGTKKVEDAVPPPPDASAPRAASPPHASAPRAASPPDASAPPIDAARARADDRPHRAGRLRRLRRAAPRVQPHRAGRLRARLRRAAPRYRLDSAEEPPRSASAAAPTTRVGRWDVSRVGFGTLALGVLYPDGRPPEDAAVSIVRAALARGCTFFDTADCYCADGGDTHYAERLLARALGDADAGSVVVSTKGGNRRRGDGRESKSWAFGHRIAAAEVRPAIAASRAALGRRHPMIWSLHNTDSFEPEGPDFADILRAMRDANDAGDCDALGLSNASARHVDAAAAVLGDRLVAVQNELSFFATQAFKPRKPNAAKSNKAGVVAACAAAGVAFVAFGLRRGVASAFGTGATAAADAALGENLKVRHRDLCAECQPLRFLYSEYDPACWYFECVECVRRLVLTCLLPLPGAWADPESIAHAVFAVAVAVLFAFLYDNLAPFLEDSVDAFADVVQFLLFVNLFTILILDCDAKMQTAEERTGLSRAGFGTANTVGALGALVVALSTNGKIAAAAVVARDKARTASCRAIESAGASEELVRKFGLATAQAADEVAALEPAADRELEAAQARPASVPPSPRKTTPRRSSPASTTRSSRRSPAATRSPSSRGAAAPPPATPRFAATASPRSRPRK